MKCITRDNIKQLDHLSQKENSGEIIKLHDKNKAVNRKDFIAQEKTNRTINRFIDEIKMYLRKLKIAQTEGKKPYIFSHIDAPKILDKPQVKEALLMQYEKRDIADKFMTLKPRKIAKLLKSGAKKTFSDIDAFTKDNIVAKVAPKEYKRKSKNSTYKKLSNIVKDFKEQGYDPIVGLKRLQKIVLDRFYTPTSPGECFIFTAVSALIANDAIKDNYEKLQQRLKASGSLAEFNKNLAIMFDLFKKGSVRQRKNIPFEMQNWIFANASDVVTIVLYEMVQLLELKDDTMNKYAKLFLHSRILRDITRIRGFAKDFNSGGSAPTQLKALVKLIPGLDPGLDIGFSDEIANTSRLPKSLYIAIDAKDEVSRIANDGGPLGKYSKSNMLLNSTNKKFIYDLKEQKFISEEGAKRYIESLEETKRNFPNDHIKAWVSAYKVASVKKGIQKVIDTKKKQLKEAPRYKVDTIFLRIPGHEFSSGHAFSYRQDPLTGKWSSYDIAYPGVKYDLSPVFNSATNRYGIYEKSHICRNPDTIVLQGVLMTKMK